MSERLGTMSISSAYDLALVGSGAASAFTLLHLLDAMSKARTSKKLRVAVIERDEQFWTGYAYGRRSSANSLLISNLREFIPDTLKDDFVSWLTASRANWTQGLVVEGGAAAKAWLARNTHDMDVGNWDEIFLPRRLFGEFLTACIEAAISRAESDGWLYLERIHGEATSITNVNEHFHLTAKDASGSSLGIKASLVALGVGSPPVRSLCSEAVQASIRLSLVDEIYTPSLDANIARIFQTMDAAPNGKKNLLLVGSNASALEVIYMCSQVPHLNQAIDNIVCLSRSGKLPEIGAKIDLSRVNLEQLERLKRTTGVRSDELLDAIKNDIARLPDQQVSTLDAFPKISTYVVAILSGMQGEQARHFHNNHGMNFTRMVRRGGQEYVDAASRLKKTGQLTSVPGAFVNLMPGDADQVKCCYIPAGASVPESHPLEFAMVVNCGGFEELDTKSSSELLRDLIGNGLCAANLSRRGLEVNNDFEASPGLFITGPLLAGTFNNRLKTWHIENARRIYNSSNDLAKIVAQRLERTSVSA